MFLIYYTAQLSNSLTPVILAPNEKLAKLATKNDKKRNFFINSPFK